MSTPMTPGSKSDTLEDVIDLAWNNEGIKLLFLYVSLLYSFFNLYFIFILIQLYVPIE